MSSETSAQFFNLKDSINQMLQQQLKLLQRSILICEQLTGKDLKELSFLEDLIDSCQYAQEINSDCAKIIQNLHSLLKNTFSNQKSNQNLISQPNKNLSQQNSGNLNSSYNNQIEISDQSLIIIKQEDIAQTQIPLFATKQLVKNVFGCYRYPYDYFYRKILGYSKPYNNWIYLKFVPKDQINEFRRFKLEEFSKFEELSGLIVPNFFKKEEYYNLYSQHSTRQYKLTLIEQQQLYLMYHSKYFSSYADIANFFCIQSASGISKNIYLYEKHLSQSQNEQQ
ncbi:hypothetical protein TTHERM_00933090 (macronuclear) [Tetrahymena thermophila SB210]|uniref:Uncharacterized protein n=1 Tax=Tetrahymena thermophila (strain SB210) TaxID=312017 RepID=I7LWF5_TETTS|nr:hypothetical protein TTHERM_00933090 [Tetrahymena thermophila SB210]EAS01620.2 hypothetical protein TTHERM_00933090 [Tetrahymena thermophila SB210]|eukprot:XP_001021865.2 hypothetical protein TTHERM_00933090 [Tetrahymena thermophila SB210]